MRMKIRIPKRTQKTLNKWPISLKELKSVIVIQVTVFMFACQFSDAIDSAM